LKNAQPQRAAGALPCPTGATLNEGHGLGGSAPFAEIRLWETGCGSQAAGVSWLKLFNQPLALRCHSEVIYIPSSCAQLAR